MDNIEALKGFLSEENIKRHFEYLRNLRLKLSIHEKSEPSLIGKSISEVSRMPLMADHREEVLRLKWRIKAHECFFGSFSLSPRSSELVNNHFCSRERFVYEIFLEAMKTEHGFLFVYLDKKRPRIVTESTGGGAFIKYEPILAVDLYEHTYFNDYGFRKDRYIRNALMYLDTEKLNRV